MVVSCQAQRQKQTMLWCDSCYLPLSALPGLKSLQHSASPLKLPTLTRLFAHVCTQYSVWSATLIWITERVFSEFVFYSLWHNSKIGNWGRINLSQFYLRKWSLKSCFAVWLNLNRIKVFCIARWNKVYGFINRQIVLNTYQTVIKNFTHRCWTLNYWLFRFFWILAKPFQLLHDIVYAFNFRLLHICLILKDIKISSHN